MGLQGRGPAVQSSRRRARTCRRPALGRKAAGGELRDRREWERGCRPRAPYWREHRPAAERGRRPAMPGRGERRSAARRRRVPQNEPPLAAGELVGLDERNAAVLVLAGLVAGFVLATGVPAGAARGAAATAGGSGVGAGEGAAATGATTTGWVSATAAGGPALSADAGSAQPAAANNTRRRLILWVTCVGLMVERRAARPECDPRAPGMPDVDRRFAGRCFDGSRDSERSASFSWAATAPSRRRRRPAP